MATGKNKKTKRSWTPHRKERNATNWTKARKREELAKKNGHPGVSPKAHNGKTTGGYSPAKSELRAAIRRAAALVRERSA
jgi:hypothetical protein